MKHALRWSLLVGLVVSTDGTQAAASSLDQRVEAFLAAPAPLLKNTPRGFRIIVLSNLAEYCAGDEVAAADGLRCLDRLVALARGPEISPFGDPATAMLGSNGLYLSHLNIVLGAYEHRARDGKFRTLNARIAHHLAEATLAANHAHVASYPSASQRWPADQAATLYSLHLYDANFSDPIAAAPIKKWLEWMDAHGKTRSGLPRSEITGHDKSSKLPRGCALSFTVRYLAPFAPERAAALWARYKEEMLVDRGVVVGFREWPEGVERAADIDSGPIIAGIGTAASGLAIGASRAVADELTHARLLSSAALAKQLVPDSGILATAIELATPITAPAAGG